MCSQNSESSFILCINHVYPLFYALNGFYYILYMHVNEHIFTHYKAYSKKKNLVEKNFFTYTYTLDDLKGTRNAQCC